MVEHKRARDPTLTLAARRGSSWAAGVQFAKLSPAHSLCVTRVSGALLSTCATSTFTVAPALLCLSHITQMSFCKWQGTRMTEYGAYSLQGGPALSRTENRSAEVSARRRTACNRSVLG